MAVIEANFTDVDVRNPGPKGGRRPLETGAYKVKITGVTENIREGEMEAKSYMVQTVVVGGDYDGSETRLYLGKDLQKQGNIRSWKAALLSIGTKPAALEGGSIRFDTDDLVNKTAYIYFKAKDENDPTSQPNREFITPESYNSITGNTGVTMKAAPTMAPAPAKGGSQLKNMLGR